MATHYYLQRPWHYEVRALSDISRPCLVERSCFCLLPQPPTVFSTRSQTVARHRLPLAVVNRTIFRAGTGDTGIINFDSKILFSAWCIGIDLRDFLGLGSIRDIGSWAICNEGGDCRDGRMA